MPDCCKLQHSRTWIWSILAPFLLPQRPIKSSSSPTTISKMRLSRPHWHKVSPKTSAPATRAGSSLFQLIQLSWHSSLVTYSRFTSSMIHLLTLYEPRKSWCRQDSTGWTMHCHTHLVLHLTLFCSSVSTHLRNSTLLQKSRMIESDPSLSRPVHY